MGINGEYLSRSPFVDDLASLSDFGELQKMIGELQSETFAVGMKIKTNKSKVTINKRAECAVFSPADETLEVEEYSQAHL